MEVATKCCERSTHLFLCRDAILSLVWPPEAERGEPRPGHAFPSRVHLVAPDLGPRLPGRERESVGAFLCPILVQDVEPPAPDLGLVDGGLVPVQRVFAFLPLTDDDLAQEAGRDGRVIVRWGAVEPGFDEAVRVDRRRAGCGCGQGVGPIESFVGALAGLVERGAACAREVERLLLQSRSRRGRRHVLTGRPRGRVSTLVGGGAGQSSCRC